MRDIRAGEEITIMYTDTLGSRATRRDSLLESHRFICKCAFCSLPREAAKISDANRAFLKATVDRLSTTDVELIPLEELQKAVRLAEQEEVWIYRTQILHLGAASLFEFRNRDMAEVGVKMLAEAQKGYATMEGEESYHAVDLKGVLNGD